VSVNAPEEPTEAELRLKQEAEYANKKLIEDINKFKVDDEHFSRSEEEVEDPRVKKFEVKEPTKIGGSIKYQVSGVDEDGEFTTIRRYREFDAL
jgi:hypothetical protein